MNKIAMELMKVAKELVARPSDQELREVYQVLGLSREPGVSGLMLLLANSIWSIDRVNWPMVKRELAKYPSGRMMIRGMESLPRFDEIAAKGYHVVMKELGATSYRDTVDSKALVLEWERFEKNGIFAKIEDEMVEYYMGPGRSELGR